MPSAWAVRECFERAEISRREVRGRDRVKWKWCDGEIVSGLGRIALVF